MNSDLFEQTLELLHEVFRTRRYISSKYLEWQYLLNPNGSQIISNEYVDGKLIGHYALIPQVYNCGNKIINVGLSCNTAVSKYAQGNGLFIKLAELTYQKAKNNYQIIDFLGVANANSTPGFLNRLKFSLLTPLPVKIGVCPFRNTTHVSIYSIDDDFLNSSIYQEIVSRIDFFSNSDLGWSQLYNKETLKWRLSSPIGKYTMLSSEYGILLSTTSRFLGINISIILKIFKNNHADFIDIDKLISAACKTHGSLFYLYAGFNNIVKVGGINVPSRFLPSPLNLIYRRLDTFSSFGFKLVTFEFLDFDAY